MFGIHTPNGHSFESHAYWYMTTCHELAHAFSSAHDQTHGSYLSYFAEAYMSAFAKSTNHLLARSSPLLKLQHKAVGLKQCSVTMVNNSQDIAIDSTMDDDEEKQYVKLVSSDEHTFHISRRCAMVSGTIKSMLSGP
ncbi:hypothetical protein SARC_14813, partial [Sphaeroforma arctica JP610]